MRFYVLSTSNIAHRKFFTFSSTWFKSFNFQLTLAPQSSDKFRSDQTQNFPALISRRIVRWSSWQTVFVCLPILSRWKIFK